MINQWFINALMVGGNMWRSSSDPANEPPTIAGDLLPVATKQQ